MTQAGLTQRQGLVVQLVAEGCSNKQIADRLRISVAGVKKHLEVLFRGYGVRNRTALVRAAIARGDLTVRRMAKQKPRHS